MPVSRHVVPPRFWVWARWRLGRGEYKPYGRANPSHRPPGLPKPIPPRWITEFDRRFPPRPKPPPPAPRRKPHPLWTSTLGVYVNIPRNAPAAELADLMRPPRYGHAIAVVGVQDHDDPTLDIEYVRDVWVPGLRARGVKVGGAQWVECADVDGEAAYAERTIRELRLDSWMLNGEKAAEVSGRSGQLVRALRALVGPDFPLAWTPPPEVALDHEAFRANGVAYCQQAYPLENRYDLLACVEVAIREGYDPAIDLVPLVGVYPVNGVVYPPGEYRTEMLATGVRSLFLYTGDAAFGSPEIFSGLAGS